MVCQLVSFYGRFADDISERDDVINEQYEIYRQIQPYFTEQSLDLEECLARQLSIESALDQFGRRFHENSLARRS